MRRLFLFFGFIVILYFSFGFYYATFDLNIYKNSFTKQKHKEYYDYRGVSHVVTSHSKGSLTPPKILLQAASADLDYLFFTDLNSMDRPYNIQGYQGDVFTFSNQKLSYLDSHILIYSNNPDFYFDNLASATAQLHQHFSEPEKGEKSFLAVLAHPFKIHHKWTGEYPIGLDGIEVINMRHQWQQAWFEDRVNFFWSIFTYPFNPKISLLRLIKSPDKELELWDFLSKKNKTLGFLGNETTAKVFNVLGLNFTFPSYQKSFSFASNHILLNSELTGHVKSDRKKIYDSIKNGHFYFAFDSLGDPKGFAAYIKNSQNNHLMGSEITFEDNLKLYVDLPKGLSIPYSTEIYRNGELYYKSDDQNPIIDVSEKGVYRVVIKIQPLLPLPDREKWFGWIYTNNFYIK